MKICQDCYAQNQDTEQKCTKCGGELIQYQSATTTKKNLPFSPKILALCGIALCFGLGTTYYLTRNNSDDLMVDNAFVGENSTFSSENITNGNNSTGTQHENEPNSDGMTNTENNNNTLTLVDHSTIDLENRVFTQYDFSYIMPEIHEDMKAFVVQPDSSQGKVDYSLVLEDLKYMVLGQDPNRLLNDNYSDGYTSILQMMWMYSMLSADMMYSYDSMESEEEILSAFTDKLEELMKYQRLEDIQVGEITVTHHLTQMTAELALEEISETMTLTAEVFHLPYPDKPEDFLEIMLIKEGEGLSESQYLPIITTLVESFISNERLMEYNEQGMAKFTSTSFSAYYNPDYFSTIKTPYRINDPSFYYIFDEIYLNLEGNSDLSVGYLNITSMDGFPRFDSEEFEVVQLGENRFHVGKAMVKVKDESGAVSERDMIVSLKHDSPDYPEFYTEIDYHFLHLGEDEYIYTESDVKLVNETFQLLMETYEVNLTPELEAIYEEWWSENGTNIETYGSEVGQQLSYGDTFDTGRGFTVQHSGALSEVYGDHYYLMWPDADKSDPKQQVTAEGQFVGIGKTRTNDFIRFFSYDGSELLPAEDLFYPEDLDRLERNELELEYESEKMTFNQKEFTVYTIKMPLWIEDAYQTVVRLYHYTENNRSYIIYNFDIREYTYDLYVGEMELMCTTLEITE